MTDSKKIVGIIGGMGPAATVKFMQQVIAATPAEDDFDHIHMIVDNNTKVPSRIAALIDGRGENPGPCIAQMAKRLETAGADFLVIPCNTAHHYYDYAAKAVSIPVSNLIELTVDTIRRRQPELAKIGLLASSAVEKIKLYVEYCIPKGLQVLYPDNQQDVLAIIKAVKADEVRDELVENYLKAITNLTERGAECIVLACTELSVIGGKTNTKLPVYDTLDILAHHVVNVVNNEIF